MAYCWRQLDGGKIMVKNMVFVAFIRSANWVWVGWSRRKIPLTLDSQVWLMSRWVYLKIEYLEMLMICHHFSYEIGHLEGLFSNIPHFQTLPQDGAPKIAFS